MGDELSFSSETLTNTYAIGCATLALGAPMLIPFALKFGSRSVYVISSAAQLAISIWAARTMTAGDWWYVTYNAPVPYTTDDQFIGASTVSVEGRRHRLS